jgi:hypothetical protein
VTARTTAETEAMRWSVLQRTAAWINFVVTTASVLILPGCVTAIVTAWIARTKPTVVSNFVKCLQILNRFLNIWIFLFIYFSYQQTCYKMTKKTLFVISDSLNIPMGMMWYSKQWLFMCTYKRNLEEYFKRHGFITDTLSYVTVHSTLTSHNIE